MICRGMRDWLGAGDGRSWDDAVHGVCSTQCMLYLVNAELGVCCTRCMLHLVYAVLCECCTWCMLYLVLTLDHDMER